ncbi:MAG: hypothetical protein GX971_06240 [Firmicutes bacterium]|nr:hypothetical protein [Bacillota bacterium]
MLRVFGLFVTLTLIMLLFTGSIASLPEIQAEEHKEDRALLVEELLAIKEAELDAYSEELQQAGEDLFSQKVGELRREQAQRFQNAVNELQAELKAQAQDLQEQVTNEILGFQLQLILVTLTPEEQQEKLAQISNLQDELAVHQEELEESFQLKLQELQTQHEQRAEQEVLALQNGLERTMNDEFAQYRLGLLEELEEELEKMGPALGSVRANRSY